MAVWLDDLFPDHPKVVAAGGDAAWLYVCGLCYCRRLLTDGRIPKPAVARLSDRKGPGKLAARLVAAGLWHDEGDHYRVHDWDEHNISAETIREKRSAVSTARSEAGRKGARTRWQGDGKRDGKPDGKPERQEWQGDSKDDGNEVATGWQPDGKPMAPTPHTPKPTGDSQLPSNLVGAPDLSGFRVGQRLDDEPATGVVGYANGNRTQLVRRLVGVCTADNRRLVETEAPKVVDHLLAVVDWRVVDEAIGAYGATSGKPPTLPRALVAAVQARVNLTIPAFTVKRS